MYFGDGDFCLEDFEALDDNEDKGIMVECVYDEKVYEITVLRGAAIWSSAEFAHQGLVKEGNSTITDFSIDEATGNQIYYATYSQLKEGIELCTSTLQRPYYRMMGSKPSDLGSAFSEKSSTSIATFTKGTQGNHVRYTYKLNVDVTPDVFDELGNQQLEVNWIEQYKLRTINYNGLTAYMQDEDVINPNTDEKCVVFIFESNIDDYANAPNGATFLGWSLTSTGNEAALTSPSVLYGLASGQKQSLTITKEMMEDYINNEITLYAVYSVTVNFIHEPASIGGLDAVQYSVNNGVDKELCVENHFTQNFILDQTVNAIDLNNNYSFYVAEDYQGVYWQSGWVDNDHKVSLSYRIGLSNNFYADWHTDTFTINFRGPSGELLGTISQDGLNRTFNISEHVEDIVFNSYRKGYNFVGWTKDNLIGFTTEAAAPECPDQIELTRTTTDLYALYTKAQVQIIYTLLSEDQANGATGSDVSDFAL